MSRGGAERIESTREPGGITIWRRRGSGVFIGRDVRVTVMDTSREGVVRLGIEAPLFMVVTGGAVNMEQHLAMQSDRDGMAEHRRLSERDLSTVELGFDQYARIGREVTIRYLGENGRHNATLLIRAHPKLAVTRDDLSYEQHIAIQNRRDANGRLHG